MLQQATSSYIDRCTNTYLKATTWLDIYTSKKWNEIFLTLECFYCEFWGLAYRGILSFLIMAFKFWGGNRSLLLFKCILHPFYLYSLFSTDRNLAPFKFPTYHRFSTNHNLLMFNSTNFLIPMINPKDLYILGWNVASTRASSTKQCAQ